MEKIGKFELAATLIKKFFFKLKIDKTGADRITYGVNSENEACVTNDDDEYANFYKNTTRWQTI